MYVIRTLCNNILKCVDKIRNKKEKMHQYPFIVVFCTEGVYGYFPDIKTIKIKAELVSTCLLLAKKELETEIKKYKSLNIPLPIANHISYYINNKNYVTNITVYL